MTDKPDELTIKLLKRRSDYLRRLIDLRAPNGVLVIATRNYLQTFEGGVRRALWPWLIFTAELWLRATWDTARMRFYIHILRFSRERAIDLAFGEDWDD